jgi:hypothetical protein
MLRLTPGLDRRAQKMDSQVSESKPGAPGPEKGDTLKTSPSIDSVWERIKLNSGQTFRQKTGGEFTYLITDEHLIPDRTPQRIPRSQFEKALKFVPLSNTAKIQHLRGPSYIFAVLMDRRIRGNDW